MQTITKSLWYDINPLIKIYVFLFVILIVSLLSNIFFLYATTLLVFVIYLTSKIPFHCIWDGIKYFVILLIPFVFLLAWLETPNVAALPLVGVTYLRFFNILFVGSIFALTTNSIDIALFSLQYKSAFMRRIGIALAAGIGSLTILLKKATNTVLYQELRGNYYSFNPFKIKQTINSFSLLLSSLVLQTIELSEDFTISMLTRGFTKGRPTLPPYFNLKKPKNFLLLIFGTIYLTVSFL